MHDPRGAVWRTWDLHVHTPASYGWQGGKLFRNMTAEEQNRAYQEIVDAMNASESAAFAIMDYWTFDGYIGLRRFLLKNPGIALKKTVFPGIELRCDAPADFRLNIHVLLSDKLTDQQLSDFKSALKVQLIDRPLSDEALSALPARLAPDKIKVLSGAVTLPENPDELYSLGARAARVTVESIRAAIRQLPARAALLFVPFDTYNGLEGVSWKEHPLATSQFMQEGHIFEVRQAGYSDLFRGIRNEQNKAFFDNFMRTLGGRPKPVVSGSDAHKLSDYGKYPNDNKGAPRRGWIKADCTFEGLLQTLAEPAARTFVGDLPRHLSEVRQRPTKYIRRVAVSKHPAATTPETWFSADIPLNQELVAIIGNKGSGKSALADIVGLLGNSHNESHFSFLNTEKFRQPKANKARHVEATLEWMAGPSSSRTLDSNVGPGDVERVKYIPQSYLETICTELGTGATTAFDCELMAVIFSHIPEAERLGKTSLDELLAFRTEAARNAIGVLKQRLPPLNARIAEIESKLTPEYEANITAQLRNKEKELEAHDSTKPAEPPAPEVDEAKRAELEHAARHIETLRGTAKALSADIAAAAADQKRLAILLAKADRVTAKLRSLGEQFAVLAAEMTPELADLGLTVADVATLEVRDAPILERRARNAELLAAASARLDGNRADSLVQKKRQVDESIADAQRTLEGPAKAIEAYKSALEHWSTRKAMLVGSAETPDSIEFYRAVLNRILGGPAELQSVRQERLALTRSIYSELSKLADTYRSVYKPLHEFTESHPLIAKGLGLNMQVSVRERGFAENFFARWNRAASGSFSGAEEGGRVMKSLLARHDFSNEEDLLAFLAELEALISRDHRSPAQPATRVAAQLRKGQTVESLYDFLFSLDYLEPHYSLRMGKKDLAQLSPGERGTLLLMFYLLIDRDDSPLVIDQPEENLDNQTVYTLLGECIKEAKSRRQIIIVTHNPNLAVACDAEQVIRAFHDPAGSPMVSYSSGAIESPEMNKHLLDVLEGTRPAFNNRESKYLD